MSDATRPFEPKEFLTLLFTSLGGVGGAAGALLTALTYAPAHSKEIVIGLGIAVVLGCFLCYVIIGEDNLARRAAVLLALVFVVSLSAVGLFEIFVGQSGGTASASQADPKYMIEFRAEDNSSHEPLDLKSIKNLKIFSIDNNNTPRKVPLDEDIKKIDIASIKTIKTTVCNLTTEYNLEGIKAASDRAIFLTVAFLVTVKAGVPCPDERGHGR